MYTLSLGHFSLPIHYAIFLAALMTALAIGTFIMRSREFADSLFDIVISGLLCARIGFVLMYFAEYRQNLWSIINIRDAGFCWWCGLIGGLIALAYQLWRKPKLRRVLLMAIGSGALVFALLFISVAAINQNSPKLADIDLPVLADKTRNLYQIAAGKPVVLNLWASWCPTCVREMPVLQQAQQTLPHISFIFANQSESTKQVIDFLDKYHLNLKNVALDHQSKLLAHIGSQGLPTTVFYNQQGELISVHIGELSAASLARELLKIPH